MAGGAQQSATPSQGGQSGQMGQGGFGNQVSSLLQNPNLPSMLQNLNTSGISPQNMQAIQQAYQNAQHPMMSAQPQMNPQMNPQMMAAAQRMQSQPGQIDASGQLQPLGPPPVQNDGGPDMTGNMQGGNQGFDQSGSDAGVGGQPVNQIQSPLSSAPTAASTPSFGAPPMLSDFRPKQGLQIQGNPTMQRIQKGIGALGRRMR